MSTLSRRLASRLGHVETRVANQSETQTEIERVGGVGERESGEHVLQAAALQVLAALAALAAVYWRLPRQTVGASKVTSRSCIGDETAITDAQSS
jgi:hypothetical protein